MTALDHDPRGRLDSMQAHPSNSRRASMIELTACPACAQPAEILHRHILGSTDGPIEHIKIRCLFGHGFFMPAALLPDLIHG